MTRFGHDRIKFLGHDRTQSHHLTNNFTHTELTRLMS
jgi:hypothetical protein